MSRGEKALFVLATFISVVILTAGFTGFDILRINSLENPPSDMHIYMEADTIRVAGGSSGSTLISSFTASGAIVQPNQPSFLTHVSPSTIANVTGDGTTYSPVAFDSEIYDQSGSLSGSTFTALVAGRYRLCTSLYLDGLTSSHTGGVVSIVTSNRTYPVAEGGFGAMRSDANRLRAGGCADADMDANDIAYVSLLVSNGSLVVDVRANSDNTSIQSFFSGYLKH